ncbi:hypothetical protein [Blastococcus sp. SYSU DS1024]
MDRREGNAMIAVNVNRSYKPGMSPDELLEIGAGEWAGIADAALEEHASTGDTVIFVYRNRMIGAAVITGATRGADGKVTFDLTYDDARSAAVDGVPWVTPWLRGQARPVQYVDPAAVDAAVTAAAAAPSHPAPPAGPREVALDGFRLSVDADGAATLVVPSGRDVIISARRTR